MKAGRAIVFIDFDGVLHPVDYLGFEEVEGELVFSKDSRFCWVGILWQLIKDRPCDLVVHSSWRHSNSLAEIRSMFPTELRMRIVGTTKGEDRYQSILDYLAESKPKGYVILDDTREEFPSNCPELILCDSKQGIGNSSVQDKLLRALT